MTIDASVHELRSVEDRFGRHHACRCGLFSMRADGFVPCAQIETGRRPGPPYPAEVAAAFATHVATFDAAPCPPPLEQAPEHFANRQGVQVRLVEGWEPARDWPRKQCTWGDL